MIASETTRRRTCRLYDANALAATLKGSQVLLLSDQVQRVGLRNHLSA